MSDAGDSTTLDPGDGAAGFGAADSGSGGPRSAGVGASGARSKPASTPASPPPLRPWAAELGGGHPGGGVHPPYAAPLLELPASAVEGIREAARRTWPQEACGLLLGSPSAAGDATRVVLALPTRNATREVARDRYEVHPEDFLAADDRAREMGLEVVGVWHSHPESGPIPSKTDFERSWPGWSYLICGWTAGDPDATPQLRSWRRATDAVPFVEERLATRLA